MGHFPLACRINNTRGLARERVGVLLLHSTHRRRPSRAHGRRLAAQVELTDAPSVRRLLALARAQKAEGGGAAAGGEGEGAGGEMLLGGLDISFVKGNAIDAVTTLSVLSYPSLRVVATVDEVVTPRHR